MTERNSFPNTQYEHQTKPFGTIRYMSPEQARGEALDARTGIFSCGLVLYEMLTGQRPYGMVEGDEMLRRLMDAEEIAPVSQQLPNIPAALDRIVMRALRKNRMGHNRCVQPRWQMVCDGQF